MFIPFKIEESGYEAKASPILTMAFCSAYFAFGGAAFNLIPETMLESMAYRFGCVPADFKIWSPVTCTFLHGDWLHLLGNIYFLWIYGSALERLIGSFRFLAIYILGAFVSVSAHCLTVPPWMADIPAIGASGAISALLGAFLVILPNVKMHFLVLSPIYSRPLPSQGPAALVVGGWFLLQILYGLKAVGDIGQVAFWAHIAGFGAGALAAWGMLALGRVRRPDDMDDDGLAEAKSFGPFEECIVAYGEGLHDEALQLAVDHFAKARDRYEPGLMTQLYIWMIARFGDTELSPWIHRDAAHAALRMRQPRLALHAFAKASEFDVFDDPKKAIAGFSAALKKAGEAERASKAGAFAASLYPELGKS